MEILNFLTRTNRKKYKYLSNKLMYIKILLINKNNNISKYIKRIITRFFLFKIVKKVTIHKMKLKSNNNFLNLLKF